MGYFSHLDYSQYMDIKLLELNIITVFEKKILTDDLDRPQIKSILQKDKDIPPQYIEVPDFVVFDYLTNPTYPVQLHFQDKREIFVISSNIELNLEEPSVVKSFSFDYLAINNTKLLKDLELVSQGFNVLFAVSPNEKNETFGWIKNKLSSVLEDKGEFFAGGARFIRVNKDGKSRLEFKIDPAAIPELGASFTGQYIVSINKHFQEPQSVGHLPPNWNDDVETRLVQFKNEALEAVKKLADMVA